jgi:hypothetical protein
MKKKAQPQFAKGNAANEGPRMRKPKPCKRCLYLESVSAKYQKECANLIHANQSLEMEEADLRKQLRGLEIVLEQQRKELAASDSALQSYVQDFQALKVKLTGILDCGRVLTRTEVLKQVSEVIQ